MSELVTSIEPALSEQLVAAISRVVGPGNVLTGDAVEEFRWDALGPWRGFPEYDALSPHPLLVARPRTTEEVSAIIEPAVFGRLLQAEDVPLGEYYFYISPVYQTGAPQYAWLNQRIAVGRGKVVGGGVEYRVWAIENAG